MLNLVAFQLGESFAPDQWRCARHRLTNVVIFSFDAVYAVYTYTKARDGGLELPVDKIGLVMSGSNLSYFVLTPLVLPLITGKFGSHRTLRLVLLVWPVLAISLPLTQMFASEQRGVMFAFIIAQQVIKTFGYFARP